MRVGRPNLSGELVAGRYRLGNVIGSGGMGVVYDATHTELKTPCAVKVVRRAADGTDHPRRLLREARVLAKLSSPHAVRVLDAGRLPDASPYLVMERLVGEPLNALLGRAGRLSVAQALLFAGQVCEAAGEAHQHGIVHRDLKPSNIFVLSDERVKVLDFGLAIRLDAAAHDSMATASEFAGSPRYMSPEQIRASAEVTASTDIWSVAVLLFEMLTGRLPFWGENTGAILASIVADPATRLRACLPSAPPELDRLIADCLEKNPRDRPLDMAALKARLDAVRAGDIAPSIAPFTASFTRQALADGADSTVVGDTAPARVPARGRLKWPVAMFVAVVSLAVLAVIGRTSRRGDVASSSPRLATNGTHVTERPASAHEPSAAVPTSQSKKVPPEDAPPASTRAEPTHATSRRGPTQVVTKRGGTAEVREAISTRH